MKFKYSWPRSLFGRLVLILVGGMVTAHALSFMVLVHQRTVTARSVMSYFVGQDIASAVAILERVPVSERATWIARLEREHYRFVLGATPQGSPLHSGPGVVLAEAARRALGPAYSLSVTAPKSARYALHTRLTDATPLTVEATPPVMAVPTELALIVGAQLMIVAACTYLAIRLVTRPLAALAAASDLSRPDMPPSPLPETGPLEVARAATAFNAMQRRIATHLAERMHILAAISHDLQTPITRLRLRTETLDNARQREKMLADLDAMQTLVEDGLVYARSAHGITESPCRTDLDALLVSMVYDYLDGGHVLALHGSVGESIATYPRTLRRILTNLINNALKFGDEVELAVIHEPTGLCIAVRDRGPGLAETELTAVFEPFYRVENSRNRETGGSGLGLAIVRQLALSMGARVTLFNREGGGLEVQLMLDR